MNSVLLFQNHNTKAFTLLEVLIAITIGSMVIGIVAMAFSLSVRNWERSKSLKSYPSTSEGLINFMEKQLIHIVKKPAPMGKQKELPFSGNKRKLIFITDFSPLGISGNCKVVARYYYNKVEKKLFYSQIIFNNSPQMADRIGNFLTSKPEEELKDSFVFSFSVKIPDISFGYKAKDDTSFRENWERMGEIPYQITVNFQLSEGSKKVTKIVNTYLLESLDQPYIARQVTSGVQ